jgi:hypothetical protein
MVAATKSNKCFIRTKEGVQGFSWNAFLLLAVAFHFLAGCSALSSPYPATRLQAVKELSDQTLLAKLAIEDENFEVRQAAAERLTDQAVLAKIVFEEKDASVRTTAMERLTDQAVLARIVFVGEYSWVRTAAVKKLTDQTVLGKVAVEDNQQDVRRAAVAKLTDEAVLAKVAVEGKDGVVRWVAVAGLTDQALLAQIAVQDTEGYVRKAAVRKLTDQAVLAQIAVHDKDEDLRWSAVVELTDQAALAKVGVETKEFDFRKYVFSRLEDEGLIRVAREAKDPAMAIAAQIRLKQINWEDAFAAADGLKPPLETLNGLGDVIGAAALVESPAPATGTVVAACHKYISQGDVSRIPELCALLMRYGDKPLAEDYLNCGRSELGDAAGAWGTAHGYSIRSGYGSHRVKWGSGR